MHNNTGLNPNRKRKELSRLLGLMIKANKKKITSTHYAERITAEAEEMAALNELRRLAGTKPDSFDVLDLLSYGYEPPKPITVDILIAPTLTDENLEKISDEVNKPGRIQIIKPEEKLKVETPDDVTQYIQYIFITAFNLVAEDIHNLAKEKGWWDGPERNEGEIIALIHSELSEALEALRKGNGPDDKVPEFNGVETELADVLIRIMDYAQNKGYKVAEALIAKHEFNKGRTYKHGGKVF